MAKKKLRKCSKKKDAMDWPIKPEKKAKKSSHSWADFGKSLWSK